MLNKLDDMLAPNLCVITLTGVCIIQFVFALQVENFYLFLFLLLSLLITFVFTFKVFTVRHQRRRVYTIVKDRIKKRGYDKQIFQGKCVSICQLTQACYIALRHNSSTDIKFFFAQHRRKVPQFLMEDEALENILNNLDYKNINVGKVIHEYSK